MVTSLSDLLRYSLQSDRRHTVGLAEELAIVDEYVSLERVRFEDRLRFERPLMNALLVDDERLAGYVSSSATGLKTISPAYCWMIESRPV